MRALNADELYEVFESAAQAAINDGDGESRKALNFAAEVLEPFAMGYLASALLEMGVGVDQAVTFDIGKLIEEGNAASPIAFGALPDVPADWPVQPIEFMSDEHHEARARDAIAQCGTCARMWDDGTPTSMTPAPSGRCPFEAFH